MNPESGPREHEPHQALTTIKELLEKDPSIFEDNLPSVQHSVKLAEQELAEEGRLSYDTIEILSDYYKEYHPRTEEEIKQEIESATKWIKSELEDLEYTDETIHRVTEVFKKMCKLMLTGNKKRLPHTIAQEIMKDYLNY